LLSRTCKRLSKDEASILETRAVPDAAHVNLLSDDWVATLKKPAIVLTGLIYFLNQVAFVGLVFFVPGMIQQMHVKSPLIVGMLSSSVGVGVLLGVLILPRIHRRMTNDCFYLHSDRWFRRQCDPVYLNELAPIEACSIRCYSVLRWWSVAAVLGDFDETASRHSGGRRASVH